MESIHDHVDELLATVWEPDLTATKTGKEKADAATFANHFHWELDNAQMSLEQFAIRMKERHPKFHISTAKRWYEGGAVQPASALRNTMSRIFGYHEPDSILRLGHIDRRKSETSKPKRPSDTGPAMASLLKSFGDSMDTPQDQTLDVAKGLLDSPLAPYLSIAIHWLEQRRT